jgi:NAD(P)H-quinone oxidoreductase subunit 4
LIAACLLLPIIGIGLYPKLMTQTYDVKAVAVAAEMREVLPIVAQQKSPIYSFNSTAPQLLDSNSL